MSEADNRHHAPATTRNRQSILDVLRPILPSRGTVLEVASGTGEHAVYFAQLLPNVIWQPSDPETTARASISAWISASNARNVLPPLDLDAASENWPIARADAVICINMIHITPWEATLGLMRGAGRILGAGEPLYLYGPYQRQGRQLEPSNASFNESLRARDPRWGLRDLDQVKECAEEHGFACENVIEMPANNLSVVLRKT